MVDNPPFSSATNTATKQADTTTANEPWVDPYNVPKSGDDVSGIGGNAPDFIKQLNSNTFGAYALGDEDCFAHSVGKATRFVAIDIVKKHWREGFGCDSKVDVQAVSLEAKTVAEVVVTKNMLNGKGMVHGGCLAYLIDTCASTPLLVLGLALYKNGVGVTQNLNINFHAPVSLGTCLRIVSTSVTLGSRIMTSRCEIFDKLSGRIIASALMNRMQPQKVKL